VAFLTVCMGEALVDLICERPVRSIMEADSFAPHFGGAVANVAIAAARGGARVALAGGAGADPWGQWLQERLRRDRVDLSLFELSEQARTPLAVVTIDPEGEATYQVYGDTSPMLLPALRDRILAAVSDAAALLISSNTLVGDEERELTMRAREVALASERPVIFDANLRLHRWRSRAAAAASANACVPGALLVRANAHEAAVMTGEEDPERAALALVKAGARMVVITLGPGGAILRGALRAQVPGVPARVLSTVGAGDMLTGTLVARLALSGFYPSAVAAALHDAVAASARACERWGALD
jgi:sugar/nucleoside kinase (ribokinase family)